MGVRVDRQVTEDQRHARGRPSGGCPVGYREEHGPQLRQIGAEHHWTNIVEPPHHPLAERGITGNTGYTLSTDAQGRYAYWVPRGRYEVIAAKDGWVPEVVRTDIGAGFVTTLDFVLDTAASCVERATGR